MDGKKSYKMTQQKVITVVKLTSREYLHKNWRDPIWDQTPY